MRESVAIARLAAVLERAGRFGRFHPRRLLHTSTVQQMPGPLDAQPKPQVPAWLKEPPFSIGGGRTRVWLLLALLCGGVLALVRSDVRYRYSVRPMSDAEALAALAIVAVLAEEAIQLLCYWCLRFRLQRVSKASLRGQASADQVLKALQRVMAQRFVHPANRAHAARAVFFGLLCAEVAVALREDRLRPRTLEMVQAHAVALALNDDFVQRAKAGAIRHAVKTAIASEQLSYAACAALPCVRAQLAVPACDVAEEERLVAGIRRLYQLRDGQHLGEFLVCHDEVPINLREPCYCAIPAVQVEVQRVRTYQRRGQRFCEERLAAVQAGTLFVTTKDILLVHDRSVKVSLSKVLDVDVDVERGMVMVVRANVQRPLLLTAAPADAVRAGACIEAMIIMMHRRCGRQ